MNVILAAIPIFFLLIAIELAIDKAKGTGHYRINDAITSLTLGVISRIVDIAKRLIPFTIYFAVYEQINLWQWQVTPWLWLVAFVVYDFFYYWLHRFHHEINILWAAHVVHHSSEDYNLTTALRQTSGNMLGWVFFLPMAVAGIPPEMFVTIAALNLVYQFWVHTQHIGTLGPLEWVFVTPSNHRVHHAQNDRYIDCNYGGVFIVWDRLFGSFVPESKEEPIVYGVRRPLNSWNPIWANFQVYAQLCRDAWHTKRWQDKLAIWFKPTGWRPADVQQEFPLQKTDLTRFHKFDQQAPPFLRIYAISQHAVLILLTLGFMLGFTVLPVAMAVLLGAYLMFFAYSNSLVLANHEDYFNAELLKYAILLTLVVMMPSAPLAKLLLLTIAGASIAWLMFNHNLPVSD